MRIGIDARLAATARGIGRYTYDLTRSLLSFGTQHEYTIFVSRGSDASWVPRAGRIVAVSEDGPRGIQEHLRVARRMQDQRLDLVHFPHAAVPLGYRRPFVVTVHDLSIYAHPEWFPRGQWLSTSLVVPRSIRKSRMVAAVSDDVRQEVISRFGISAERVIVLPNGIDLSVFVPAAHPSRSSLLYVGTAAPYKNVPLLNRIVERGGMACTVVGSSQRDFSQALHGRKPSDHFSFIDNIEYQSPRLVELYQHALCLLQTSLYESFALPMLESLACATPVLASDISSLHTIYGTAVEFLPLDHVEPWVDAIGRLGAHPASAPEPMRQTLIGLHDWQVLVPRLEQLYQTAVTNR